MFADTVTEVTEGDWTLICGSRPTDAEAGGLRIVVLMGLIDSAFCRVESLSKKRTSCALRLPDRSSRFDELFSDCVTDWGFLSRGRRVTCAG